MYRRSRWLLALGALAIAAVTGSAQAPVSSGAPGINDFIFEDAPKGVEVQTRGPVHEAFAEPADPKPLPSDPVPKEPPPPIREVPPTDRPEGANVQWISGYWGWDPARSDFVWVSGVYRNAPTGMQFIPGHWTNSPEGWRWIAGFWAPETRTDITYLPEPPAPLQEQVIDNPASDTFYVPGNWMYDQSSYRWRSGYYSRIRPGYIWHPSYYSWGGQRGYVYVNGYWDYPFESRGLLYAPVYFDQPYWNDSNWYYRPSYGLRSAFLLGALFGHNNHYFFGDYYGDRYFGLGFRPWYDHDRWGHDPAFRYYQWQNRNNPNWASNLQHTNEERRAGRLAAPPATLAQQNALNRQLASSGKANRAALTQNTIVAPAAKVASINNVKTVKVNQTQIQNFQSQSQQQRKTAAERTRLEANGSGQATANAQTKGGVQKMQLTSLANVRTAKSGSATVNNTTINNNVKTTNITKGGANTQKGVASSNIVNNVNNKGATSANTLANVNNKGASVSNKGPTANNNAVNKGPTTQALNAQRNLNVTPAKTQAATFSKQNNAVQSVNRSIAPTAKSVNSTSVNIPRTVTAPRSVSAPTRSMSSSVSTRSAPRSAPRSGGSSGGNRGRR